MKLQWNDLTYNEKMASISLFPKEALSDEDSGVRREAETYFRTKQELDLFMPNAPNPLFIPGDSIEPTHPKPLNKRLRDEFAMAFPHLSDEQIDDEIEPGESPIECQARLSYQYADAMMKEREK